MAKISDLTELSQLSGTELIPIVTEEQRKKVNKVITTSILVEGLKELGSVATIEIVNNYINNAIEDKVTLVDLANALSVKSDTTHNHDTLYSNVHHTHNYVELRGLPTLPTFTDAEFEECRNLISKMNLDITTVEVSVEEILEQLEAILKTITAVEENLLIELDRGLDNLNNKLDNYALKSELPTNAETVNGFTVWAGTQSEYDKIESKSNTTIYFIIRSDL